MNNKELKWHERFIKLAHEVASWSKDPSTKVGCILVKDKKVISTGYNGFPKGISDSFERLNDRATKYETVVHAETNAITAAALHGVSTDGASAYVTFHPCSRCSAVLINAGIKSVFVSATGEIPSRWLDNFLLASSLFEEAGVECLTISFE